MSEGFLERWSRRKLEGRTAEATEPGRALPDPAFPPTQAPEAPPVPQAVPMPEPAPLHPEFVPGGDAEKTPPLTLADVEGLGLESDFRPFLSRGVVPEVKNAAFRKLFSDPHFNVMDGLDTYVDDYSNPTPMPASILRQMASAKFLRLFDEEPMNDSPGTVEPLGVGDAGESAESGVLPRPPSADAQPVSQQADDHHADLRLQPDDAARAEDARRHAG